MPSAEAVAGKYGNCECQKHRGLGMLSSQPWGQQSTVSKFPCLVPVVAALSKEIALGGAEKWCLLCLSYFSSKIHEGEAVAGPPP